jgi:hypothetical protein
MTLLPHMVFAAAHVYRTCRAADIQAAVIWAVMIWAVVIWAVVIGADVIGAVILLLSENKKTAWKTG